VNTFTITAWDEETVAELDRTASKPTPIGGGELDRQSALAIAAAWIDNDDAVEDDGDSETNVCHAKPQVRKPSHYGLCGGFDDIGVSVTRINPKRLSRGYLEPGEPLYVRMPVSERRIEREMIALKDDDDN